MKFEFPLLKLSFGLICLVVFVQIVRGKQINKPDANKGHYEAPLIPYLPCFGIYINLLLSWEPSFFVQGQLLLLTAVGLAIYFVYGIHHSALNQKDL